MSASRFDRRTGITEAIRPIKGEALFVSVIDTDGCYIDYIDLINHRTITVDSRKECEWVRGLVQMDLGGIKIWKKLGGEQKCWKRL